MTIHKEGKASILIATITAAAIIISANKWVSIEWLQNLLYLLGAFIFFIVLQFFRKPDRSTGSDNGFITAPADGKIVVIENTHEPEYFNDERTQVSTFMSPLNVHINWFPVSGTVKYVKYHPGLFLVAWHPKSSTENERTTIVIETADGQEILIRQIAGALARRIVHYPKVGDKIKQGDELGFIKFGSRVDLFLPKNSKVDVAIDDKMVGNRSIIGELPKA